MTQNLLRRCGRVLQLVALLSMVVMPLTAEGAPVLDQSCCGVTNLSSFMNDLTRAQTFTVGITGTLTSVDVLLSRFDGTGSVQFDVVPGFGSGATVLGLGAPLASYTLTWNTALVAATYVNLDFADLAVNAGDFLAIVMRPSGPINGSWVGGTGNPYLGGEALTTTIFGATFTNDLFGSSDFGFRTYVDPATSIPEPATFTLFGAAIGASLIRRYRRRGASHD